MSVIFMHIYSPGVKVWQWYLDIVAEEVSHDALDDVEADIGPSSA